MATARDTTTATEKGIPTLAAELKELVVAYVKQETVVPIKGLGRFVAFGVAGSAVLSLGLVLLVLSLLRVLQSETDTTFTGNLSWAPYAITLVVCAVIAGLAARAIGSHKRRTRRRAQKARW